MSYKLQFALFLIVFFFNICLTDVNGLGQNSEFGSNFMPGCLRQCLWDKQKELLDVFNLPHACVIRPKIYKTYN